MRRLLPPVLLVLLALALAALWRPHAPATGLMHDAGLPVADVALASALGLALLIGARAQFARRDAEILTFAAPRNLVTGGLFHWSRNRMCLGFTILLLAAALAVNTWCALLGALPSSSPRSFGTCPMRSARRRPRSARSTKPTGPARGAGSDARPACRGSAEDRRRGRPRGDPRPCRAAAA